MTELQQALYALVDHPPVAPSDIEVVAARGMRFVRRRRMLRGAAALAVVVIASAAGFGLAQQNSDPGVFVATEGAGPPVSYTDAVNDAPGVATDAAAIDIVQVGWAPGFDVDTQRGGYSTSITVAGTARTDRWYVSYGVFTSDVPGEQCQLYNFLTPGITAYANAFCGSVNLGTRRLVGRVEGSQVTSTPTATGGTLLTATFDDSTLPPLLEASGRMLSNLSAFTCTGTTEGGGCEIFPRDDATSTLTYRV
ncbi:MAG: hypothetical protein QOC92_1826 [Acidimicrobiaceae bacterium]|jgi:hypothetical protein